MTIIQIPKSGTRWNQFKLNISSDFMVNQSQKKIKIK